MSQNRSTQPANDLRVRRTRKLLRDALVALIAEHGYEALHVNDIADRAMINRATFYRHYADKHELLARCMDDVYDDLVARTHPPPRTPEEIDLDAGRENMRLMFEHVAENAEFYKVMLGAGPFRARIHEYLEAVLRGRWEVAQSAYATPPRVPPPMVIAYTAAALIGLIAWWVERGCEQPPAQMAEHAAALIRRGPAWALGLDDAAQRGDR